jgi:hypothetical protein
MSENSSMRWTFLQGTIVFVGGALGLFGALAFMGLLLAIPFHRHETGFGLLFLAFVAFVGLNLMAIGLYRMLRHLYRSISRTDQATDRPIRGSAFYLLGYLGSLMATTTLFFFASLPIFTDGNAGWDKVVWGVVPTWFVVLGFLLAFFVGLVMMLTDIYDRYGEIARRRVAELERLDPDSDEPVPQRAILLPIPDHPDGIEPRRQKRD